MCWAQCRSSTGYVSLLSILNLDVHVILVMPVLFLSDHLWSRTTTVINYKVYTLKFNKCYIDY